MPKFRLLTILMLVLMLFVFAVTNSFGAWSFQESPTGERTKIPDSEYKFKLGEISCVISQPKFMRAPDDTIMEGRELYCWVSKDTRISVFAHCDLPLYTFTGFQIKKGDRFYGPTLICGPNK